MKIKIPALGLLIGALFVLEGCASSAFINTKLVGRACVDHVRQVLYDSDFSENLSVLTEAGFVTGRHGGYDADVYCDDVNHLVRVDIHGLDQDQIEVYQSIIIRKF